MLRWCDYDNGTQQFEPELAKSWEVAPDGVTWTFHLRKGAAFSDGHPMTAEDVLFSFQVAYDKNVHPAIQDLLKIGGEEFQGLCAGSAHDRHKYAEAERRLARCVMPGRLVDHSEAHARKAVSRRNVRGCLQCCTPPDQLVAGGAWRVVQYVPGEKAVLVRNPYYFGFDQQQPAAAVSGRGRLSRHARSGCRRSEVPFGRRSTASTTSSPKTIAGTRKTRKKEISPCTTSGPRKAATFCGST